MVVILLWGVSGPLFGFSDTWQLVINTGTTIITFLMVFLIQNTQNRDGHALQLKLDELIRATQGAHVALLDMEELTEEELMKIKDCFTRLAEKGRQDLEQGSDDTDTPRSQKSSGLQASARPLFAALCWARSWTRAAYFACSAANSF